MREELKRPMKLTNLLKKRAVSGQVKWEYYGYGILNCWGEHDVKEIPYDVKIAKCFAIENDVYKVDGAL